MSVYVSTVHTEAIKQHVNATRLILHNASELILIISYFGSNQIAVEKFCFNSALRQNASVLTICYFSL